MSVDLEKSGAGTGSGVSRDRPRRRWSEAKKRRIVAETYEPGASVSVVARRHDVNANLLFNWRRQFREAAGGGFLPVVAVPAGLPEPPASSGDAVPGDASAPGRIEIALAGGCRVTVDRAVDAGALTRVLAVLEGR